MPAVVNPDGGDPQGDERRKRLIQESHIDDPDIDEARTKIGEPSTYDSDKSPLGVKLRMPEIERKRTDDHEHEE